MIHNVQAMCQGLDFPAEATLELIQNTKKLQETEGCVKALQDAMELLYTKPDNRYEIELARASQRSSVHRYAVDMIFFLSAAPALKECYTKGGIGEEIFWASMRDLRYKLIECHDLHGIWGTFVGHWFPGFFRMNRFALGRLQYERRPFTATAYKDYLTKNELGCKCHIPSSGPLRYEEVLDSLRHAYAFYKDLQIDGVLPIFCNSWLLYPPLADRFPATSNIGRFYRLFDVISLEPKASNDDFWRIFNLPYDVNNLINAPERSSLQRTVKHFLLEGNCLGNGLGVILVDGERVLTEWP